MICKLFRWLFGLCEHKWERIERIDVYEENRSERPYQVKHILQCEKCGNLKKKAF